MDPVAFQRAHNQTTAAYPREATLPELFDAVSRRFPNHAAVASASGTLTYSVLCAQANALAWELSSAGLSGRFIGVQLPRSPELIVALLGILKAGAAYVPLGPVEPQSRLASLSRRVHAGATLDDVVALRQLRPRPQAPPPACAATSPAYAMYTSGSTGQPKAVVASHRNVVRLIHGQDYAPFGPAETFLQLAPPTFDAATFEIWGALLTGARLLLGPEEPFELYDLAATLTDTQVTVAWLTAGLFQQCVDLLPRELASIPVVLAGGDVVSPSAAQRHLSHGASVLVNGYGPTEATTFALTHKMTHPDAVTAPIPIGRPLRNTRVYVLNADLQPLAPGEFGELCIAGDGVSQGYLDDPALTAERFLVTTTLGAQERVYRTGDVGRFRPDGILEFHGRNDRQLKIQGFRIEPAEVERQFEQQSGVSQVVVNAVDGAHGSRLLVAWVVATDACVTRDALLAGARALLPRYLIPDHVVLIDELPLTSNGKVDRAALDSDRFRAALSSR